MLPHSVGVWNKCSVHLINDGITVVRNSDGVLVNAINWGLSAPSGVAKSQTKFKCILDGSMQEFDCKQGSTIWHDNYNPPNMVRPPVFPMCTL